MQPETGVVPLENLDLVALAVAEDEQASRKGIQLELLSDDER